MNSKPLYFLTLLFFLASIGLFFFIFTRGVARRQDVTPSKAAEVDPDKCQGNPNPQAKCFDCRKDATDSGQINELDFAGCFKKFYGKEVGK